MGLEPRVALQTVDIAIEACHEFQGEPQIDDGRGGPFGRPAFFRGVVSSRLWRRGARAGGAGTSRGCGHAVFLLPDQGRLPSLVSTIQPIFVVYNSFHRLCFASLF